MNVLADTVINAMVSEDPTALLSIEEIKSNLKLLDSFDEGEDAYKTYTTGQFFPYYTCLNQYQLQLFTGSEGLEQGNSKSKLQRI
jgi:hypothetical protein